MTMEFAAELKAYFKGDLRKFSFTADLINTSAFQKKVLEATYAIPYGQIRSYGELAMESGYPNAYRAVGSTMKMNPVPLVIPCHRVVKSDGSIGEFGGRKELKKKLLELEGIDVDRDYRYNLEN
jgi:O-6-methylguanine DNA methyltransferase